MYIVSIEILANGETCQSGYLMKFNTATHTYAFYCCCYDGKAAHHNNIDYVTCQCKWKFA